MVLVQEVALAFVWAGSILFVSLVSVLEIFMSLTMVDFLNFIIELELLDLPAVRVPSLGLIVEVGQDWIDFLFRLFRDSLP